MERDEIEKILDKIDASKILDVKVKEELEKSFILTSILKHHFLLRNT